VSQEYGFLIGALGHKVSTLHAFTWQEYETEIRGMLEQTGFKSNYQMALTDIWMRITLKKR